MRMSLEQIQRIVEAMQPGPVTVLAAYGDGSRRRLTAQEFLEDREADLLTVYGNDLKTVEQILDKYADLDGEIAIK